MQAAREEREVPAEGRFAPGEADATDAEGSDQPDRALDLLEGKDPLAGEPRHVLGGHAVGAAEVAAVGDGDPEGARTSAKEIRQDPAVAAGLFAQDLDLAHRDDASSLPAGIPATEWEGPWLEAQSGRVAPGDEQRGGRWHADCKEVVAGAFAAGSTAVDKDDLIRQLDRRLKIRAMFAFERRTASPKDLERAFAMAAIDMVRRQPAMAELLEIPAELSRGDIAEA